MACIKRVWDYRAWDLGLIKELLLERSEESLKETSFTDVSSSKDEGIQGDDEDKDKDEGDDGHEWDEGDEWDQGDQEEGRGEADIEEDETEADENEAEDLTWTGLKDNKLGGAVSELLEFLFELNVMFITDEFTNRRPSSNLVVYFSGALGFSADAKSF
ncbi:hypothetical protein H2199_001963 [Coniosporium tulheliwenetii]|uniref:Uncharacterized protein n=1 Tax=Coniosporium tulheliwenetii TaxID=3383036 RepID=A0ACC2ZHI7_9PEZI|nr:hypothetical protein H2199_001963 [Cladosporium sp. JES 115]